MIAARAQSACSACALDADNRGGLFSCSYRRYTHNSLLRIYSGHCSTQLCIQPSNHNDSRSPTEPDRPDSLIPREQWDDGSCFCVERQMSAQPNASGAISASLLRSRKPEKAPLARWKWSGTCHSGWPQFCIGTQNSKGQERGNGKGALTHFIGGRQTEAAKGRPRWLFRIW
jgi:hypothetical protein